MGEIGIGLSIGLEPVRGGIGGGTPVPQPDQLSNLIAWFSADGSVPTAAANHTPGTPYHMLGTQTLTNLAPSSTYSFSGFESALASGRPYYHTADWAMTAHATTVSAPGGHPFICLNNGDDSGLTNCTSIRLNLNAATALQSGYSGLFIMYCAPSAAVARNVYELRGSGSYSKVAVGEDVNWTVQDSATSGLITVSSANAYEDAWGIYTWTHDGTNGVACAIDGVRMTMTGVYASLTGDLQFDELMGGNTELTTGYTEVILYEAAHSLADLDVVAAQFASKYGLTYTAP